MRLAALFLVLVTAGGSARADEPDRHQKNWEPHGYRMHCTHDNCMSAHYSKFERWLKEIAGAYRADGWKAAPNFGPVEGSGEDAHVRIFDKPGAGYAYTTKDCNPQRTTTVNFGQRTRNILGRAHMLFYFIAHEFFHVLQPAYPAHARCDEKRDGWVTESMATEYGMAITRRSKEFSGRFPLKNEREVLSDAGGRDYTLSLNKVVYDEDGKERRTGKLIYYRTSSLWRHLAEIYHGGSLTYLQRYMSRKATGDDWLRWLHKNLEKDPAVHTALGPVFALLVADVAGWARKGGPAEFFGPEEWRRRLFSRCLRIELSTSRPWAILPTRAQRTAARCVVVKVEGLEPDQRVSVKAGVLADSKRQADQIQLSLAETTDKRGFHCAEGLRSKGKFGLARLEARLRCLFLANTGWVTMGNVTRWARVWHVIPQYPGAGGGFENIYLVSRVSTDPSDDPSHGDGGDLMDFKMVFTLDTGEKKIDGKSNGKKVVIHLNEEAVHNSQEQVPKHNKAGGKATPLLYPHAPKKQVIPPIPLHPVSKNNKKGIWMMRLTEVTAQEDTLYTETLREGDSLAVFPVSSDEKSNRPLQIGDQGSFKAHVQGTVGRLPVFTKTPATLAVHKFSPYGLQATLSGTLCDAPLDRRDKDECLNPRSLSATMIKGFAGLHHPSSRFVVEDTPGTKQLRQVVSNLMQQHARARAGGQGGGNSGAGSKPPPVTGPYSSKVHRVGTCKCTCNDIHYLESLKKKIRSGKVRESPALLKQVMQMARCMRPCTPYYMKCAKKRRGK